MKIQFAILREDEYQQNQARTKKFKTLNLLYFILLQDHNDGTLWYAGSYRPGSVIIKYLRQVNRTNCKTKKLDIKKEEYICSF